MRIESLEILSPWKNLEGLRINFDEDEDITVIIGQNGAAKSNLFETIITIFAQIDSDGKSPFAYDLKYRMGVDKIHASCIAGERAKFTHNDSKISKMEVREKYFPEYIVGYYSGVSDRFETIFSRYDKEALLETINRVNSDRLEFRNFIYARPEHGLFALLAFYYNKDERVTKFLTDYARIDDFDSLFLRVKIPSWGKGKKVKAEDFWGAKGPVRDLLEKIRKYSLAPFQIDNESVYLFVPDTQSIRKIAIEYGQDPKALFQALDTMRLSDLIGDFKIRVKIKGSSSIVHLRQLSEGEQQLLTVLGLMRFTRKENSLYILDEPDTHLNPAWGINYIDILRDIGGIDENSHTLIATHDPLLVSGLIKEEIRVLRRELSGKVIAVQPEESPRGTGVGNVITSPLFGLESQLDNYSLTILRRIYEVSDWEKGTLRDEELKSLKALVPPLGMIESSPDPYRNIAREAYRMALKQVSDSKLGPSEKSDLIKKLSEKLYSDSRSGE